MAPFFAAPNTSKAITMRFGSDAAINGEVIRIFIDAARNALMNPTSDVVLKVEDVSFQSGTTWRRLRRGRSWTLAFQ